MREKKLFESRYVVLSITTNMFMFGAAYDDRELFLALGFMLIELKFPRRRKHK